MLQAMYQSKPSVYCSMWHNWFRVANTDTPMCWVIISLWTWTMEAGEIPMITANNSEELFKITNKGGNNVGLVLFKFSFLQLFYMIEIVALVILSRAFLITHHFWGAFGIVIWKREKKTSISLQPNSVPKTTYLYILCHKGPACL